MAGWVMTSHWENKNKTTLKCIEEAETQSHHNPHTYNQEQTQKPELLPKEQIA